MNTKIVFFMKPDSFKGKLMKVFTGCYAYHCGILIEDTQMFYDMFWMRRRTRWVDVLNGSNHAYSIFKIVESPVEISESYLIHQILNANTHYGIMDYARFAFRWAYHLFGKATPNASGLICSEMVHNDLIAHHWNLTVSEVPSPCELIKALTNIHCRSKLLFGKLVSDMNRARMQAVSTTEVV